MRWVAVHVPHRQATHNHGGGLVVVGGGVNVCVWTGDITTLVLEGSSFLTSSIPDWGKTNGMLQPPLSSHGRVCVDELAQSSTKK